LFFGLGLFSLVNYRNGFVLISATQIPCMSFSLTDHFLRNEWFWFIEWVALT